MLSQAPSAFRMNTKLSFPSGRKFLRNLPIREIQLKLSNSLGFNWMRCTVLTKSLLFDTLVPLHPSHKHKPTPTSPASQQSSFINNTNNGTVTSRKNFTRNLNTEAISLFPVVVAIRTAKQILARKYLPLRLLLPQQNNVPIRQGGPQQSTSFSRLLLDTTWKTKI